MGKKVTDEEIESKRAMKAFFDSLKEDDQKKVKGLQSERTMRFRLCAEPINKGKSGDAKCLLCKKDDGTDFIYKAFNNRPNFGFDWQKVALHFLSSCSEAGLLKLIEIALTNRGTHKKDNYFAANKKPKLDGNADIPEEDVDEAIQAIEEVVSETLPKKFKCCCGKKFKKGNSNPDYMIKIKTHVMEYCPFYQVWCEKLMKLEHIDGNVLTDVKLCEPFGDWNNDEREAIYYVHIRKLVAAIFPHVLLKQVISYHGSTGKRKDGRDGFLMRFLHHSYCETIEKALEEMVAVLAGEDDSIHLIETLALVLFRKICELKNSNIPLLPLITCKKSKIETALRTLNNALCQFYKSEVDKIPTETLRTARKQYKDKVRRELDELED